MGRTGQKLRANPPGSSLSQNIASSRSHPYALSLNPHSRAKADAANASTGSRQTPQGSGGLFLSSSALTSPSISETTTPTINSSADFGNSASTTVDNKPTNCIMDDDWSPFNDPNIKQSIAQSFSQKPQPSLFDRSESMSAYTPMYTPMYPTGYSSQQHIVNPNLYTRTTYEGYSFPQEQITVRILDIDSGEYLCQFPQR
ncbi:hypothetical protein J3B02_002684 [Coemansia erecta]|uniref:Uncharacterized protein n=1 Tax=Coemansia asiatica TaxID=1052880 RepID=A0A9W7XIQ4_9FUNG|nr:hypothetical protein LPJ64_002970 [Coemansia asiatica]KAJ2854411.1 hypothetical protein J3B02_002684 [Coemansia erecta]KAJ2882384.1 hypothetical protein FB639_002399 [Coemansia asiatica]